MKKIQRIRKTIGTGLLLALLVLALLPASAFADEPGDRKEQISGTKQGEENDPMKGWVDNGDGTWTYTFDVHDDTAKYYVWEEELNGYLSDIPTDPGYILINEDEITGNATITNTSTTTGSLMLTKFVSGDGLTMIDGGTRTVTQYSHTDNISDDGTKNGNYANNVTSNQVIAIPGAECLHVKVVYGGESVSYDYVCLWSGSHPDYTAAGSQSAEGFIAKLGGGSYTSADNTKEYDIQGDSVTFAFRSDGSGVGDGYGYYAVVTAEIQDQYAKGDFDFTITLSGSTQEQTASLAGKKIFGGVVFTDGVAHVKLHDKQSLTIDGLPEGITYKITEGADANYKTVSSGEDGTIESGETSVSVFRNKYTPPESNDELYNVTLAKVEEGDVEEAGTYQFYVHLTGLAASQEYQLSNGDTFTSFTDGTADFTVEITAGEQVVIYGLPEGATYQVTEAAGDYTASYRVTNVGTTGAIAKTTDSNETANEALTTAEETVDAGEEITVTFTNTVERKQKLTLRKEASGLYTDENTEFTFTLAFSGMPSGTILDSDFGRFVEDDGEAEKTFVLHPGEELVIEDIPVGVRWKVTEARSNYIASYTVDGKTVVSESGANTEGNKTLSTATETIDIGEDGEVVFTNVLWTSDLTVGKTITGNMADMEKKFDFTVTAEYNGIDISGTFEAEDENGDPVTGGITFTNGTASFELGHTEKIKIKGLPVGTSYTITENPENYTETSTGATGTVKGDGTSKADFTNDLDVAVPTDQRTGGILAGILIAIGAAAGVGVYAWKKRKGDAAS